MSYEKCKKYKKKYHLIKIAQKLAVNSIYRFVQQLLFEHSSYFPLLLKH